MKEAENIGKILIALSSKLGVEILQRYSVRSYDATRDRAASAKFQLIFKNGLFGGKRTIFLSNELGDTSDGIQDVQEYLSYLPQYKDKLSVVAEKIKLDTGCWTLVHEYYYALDGDEVYGEEIAKSLNLKPEDEHRLAEMYKEQAEKESQVVGWFPFISLTEAEEYARMLTEVAHRPLNLSSEQLDRLRQSVADATRTVISEQDNKK